MSELIFYDVHEQTKYQITISKPANMEDLSDMFITAEELRDLTGSSYFNVGEGAKPICLQSVVEAEVNKLTEKLDASGKKSLLIEDEELLEVLKNGYLSDFLNGSDEFGRHGNRICYARRYKRKKHKATQSDVTGLWFALQDAFKAKFNVYPSHIPRYERHIPMFKAFQKIVGWRRVRATTTNKERAKFYRQIWDNPEEYIK